MHFHNIASAFFNTPLLLAPQHAEVVKLYLLSRMRGTAPEIDLKGEADALIPEASRFAAGPARDAQGQHLPFARTPDGTAVITTVGKLVNRGAWVGAYSGAVSYEGFKFQLASAARDPDTRAIVLDLQTPGGEALGAFEAADAVAAVAREKPVVAVVNGLAASAGYALASGASKIVTTPSGISGSIGVIYTHFDFSKALEKEGIKPTMIFAGEHKADGNAFEPLPEDVRERIQAEVGELYEAFLATVARGRGSRLTVAKARATQAGVFVGQAAVEAGLADEVGTFESVLAELSRASAGRTTSFNSSQRKSMTQQSGAPDADANTGITQAQLDAAVKAARAEGFADGHAAGLAEGIEQGTKAANERLGAVFSNESVKGKERAALDLAIRAPGMSAADVAAFVSEHGKGSANAFEARMAAEGGSELGSESAIGQQKQLTGRELGREKALRAKGKLAD